MLDCESCSQGNMPLRRECCGCIYSIGPQYRQLPRYAPVTYLSALWPDSEHMLLECTMLQQCRDEYHTADL